MIQQEQDPSLSFRYACRIAMCGSCGMVINGREGLACKTVLADLKAGEITLRPLNHLPIIKDLGVDMDPFFDQYVEGMPYFEPASGDDGACDHPARFLGATRHRPLHRVHRLRVLRLQLHHGPLAQGLPGTGGPQPGLHAAGGQPRRSPAPRRLAQVLRELLQLPYGAELHRGLPQGDQRHPGHQAHPALAVREGLRPCRRSRRAKETPCGKVSPSRCARDEPAGDPKGGSARRRFLTATTGGIGAAAVLFLGGLFTTRALAPAMRDRPRHWVRVGHVGRTIPGRGASTRSRSGTRLKDGFYRSTVEKPVLVSRIGGGSGDSSRSSAAAARIWDARSGGTRPSKLFLCACHGGTFYPDGRVKAGPPAPAPGPLPGEGRGRRSLCAGGLRWDARWSLPLQQRLGWEKHLKPFLEKPLTGDLNWILHPGRVLCPSLRGAGPHRHDPGHVLQPVPGACLSVHRLHHEGGLSGRRILRGIHHWGAGAMVILVGVHMVDQLLPRGL